MCGGDCVWGHNALCLHFKVWHVSGAVRDAFGWEAGAFPPANDSVQVRLRAQRLDAFQTEESYRYEHSGHEKERLGRATRSWPALCWTGRCQGARRGPI